MVARFPRTEVRGIACFLPQDLGILRIRGAFSQSKPPGAYFLNTP